MSTKIKIKFVIDNVDRLILTDRIKILEWFKKNSTLKISENSDGCRINITNLAPEKVDDVYKIVKALLIIAERFRL